MRIKSSRITAILIAISVVFIWSTSIIIIKFGLEEMPSLTFAGLRNVIAFFSLLPVAIIIQKRSGKKLLPKQHLAKLAVLGILLYGATQGAMFLALSYLPAVTTNLIWTFSTIIVAILGIVFLAERPTPVQWLGIALTIIGALIYFYPVNINADQWIGIIISIIGTFTNAGAVILGRDVNRSYTVHPIVVTVISMGIGSAALLSAAVIIQGLPAIELSGWIKILWLAIINSALGFTIWNYILRTLTAAESSIINSTMLIWIPILAVIFLHEQINSRQIIALIAVGIGVLFVQLRRFTGQKTISENRPIM